jgi:hypothetical protein
MKLERIHEYVVPAVVVLCGMLFALLAGNMTAKGQMGSLAAVFAAAAAVTTLLVLRARVWILMPILWPLTGQVQALPLPFSVRQLAVFTVAGAFIALIAFKIIRLKPSYRTVDLIMLGAVLYLGTVYLRNPVGVEALGSARIGGRPYFDVAVAVVAYFVLIRSHLTAQQSLVLPFLMMGSRAFDFLLNFVADRIPQIAPYMAEVYSGIDLNAFNASIQLTPGGEGTQRQNYMASMGSALVLAVCSKWRPLHAINPLRFGPWLLLVGGLVLVLLSGFRSILAWCIAIFGISSYLQKGRAEILRLALIALPILVLVILLQGRLFNLPLAAQRALSFLPGHWDHVAISDARGSTKWRTDMWKEMLTSDRYIESKWFGDGFGYTQYQLDSIRRNIENLGGMAQQENFMIQGQVHSGPVSAIRYVGYVGLGFHLILLGCVAATAWKLIRQAEITPFYFLALFIGVPLIWEPFAFVLIFGAYEHSLPEAIFGIGMLRMLENSMRLAPPEKIAAPPASPAFFPVRHELASARASRS